MPKRALPVTVPVLLLAAPSCSQVAVDPEFPYDASGAPLGVEFQVNSSTTGHQGRAKVASAPGFETSGLD
jgi:hypothetical protein